MLFGVSTPLSPIKAQLRTIPLRPGSWKFQEYRPRSIRSIINFVPYLCAPEVSINAREYVLLTGAGFTKNFGAPLAKDFWALIFNHPNIHRRPELRRLLQKQFDFEDAYHQVMSSSDFDAEDRRAITKVVWDAFDHIDSIVKDAGLSPEVPNLGGVRGLLKAFAGTKDRPGFIFTLNQDLFVERHYHAEPRPLMPYIPSDHVSFRPIRPDETFLDWQKIVDVAVAGEFSLVADALYFIKLHGSCNWKKQDDTGMMVIGRAKENAISDLPLLSFYAALFRRVIVEGSKRVLCIGYGFGDGHINDVLADGAAAGTEIYVLDPTPAKEFAKRLRERHRGLEIWRRLARYFPYELATLYPSDQRVSHERSLVYQQFFGSTAL